MPARGGNDCRRGGSLSGVGTLDFGPDRFDESLWVEAAEPMMLFHATCGGRKPICLTLRVFEGIVARFLDGSLASGRSSDHFESHRLKLTVPFGELAAGDRVVVGWSDEIRPGAQLTSR